MQSQGKVSAQHHGTPEFIPGSMQRSWRSPASNHATSVMPIGQAPRQINANHASSARQTQRSPGAPYPAASFPQPTFMPQLSTFGPQYQALNQNFWPANGTSRAHQGLQNLPSYGQQSYSPNPRFLPISTATYTTPPPNREGSYEQLMRAPPRHFASHVRPGASFDARASSQSTAYNRSCRLHLYGLNKPPVVVKGSDEALQKLRKAVKRDGLVVKQEMRSSDRDVLDESLKFHQARGAWPTFDHGSHGRFALEDMDEDGLLRFGITRADLEVNQRPSIYSKGEPPYRTRDVNLDGILTLQRIISKYHDSGSPHGPRTWALGIVDKFLDGTFQVKLFPADDSPSTHELWLLREVLGDPRGDFVELWRPFCSQSGAIVGRERYARPTLRHPKRSSNSENAEYDPDRDSWSPEPQPKSKPRNLHRYNHRTARWARYKHLSWEEILDEGKIPLEEFCGEVMLAVAAHFSNKEISQRTNAWRPQETSDNQVWQVIKRALKLKAGTPGWPHDYKATFKHFEQVRVGNNAKREVHANRRSRIGMAPQRRHAYGSRARRISSEGSLESEEMDDLPIYTDDAHNAERTREQSIDEDDAHFSDEGQTVQESKRPRRLPARRAKAIATKVESDVQEVQELDGLAEQEDGEDDDGSAYEDDGEEE